MCWAYGSMILTLQDHQYLKQKKWQKILTKKDYYNYELVYGGTDGKSIAIDYREFTSDDLASPAFYQNYNWFFHVKVHNK